MIICIKEPGKQIQYRVVTEISLELLPKLARVLKCSVDELLKSRVKEVE